MTFVCGLNYEGGKIINHILREKDCLAFANVQIRMDAPWLGEVANDAKRYQDAAFAVDYELSAHRLHVERVCSCSG